MQLATPCATFSIARRPAVRSKEFPLGLPELGGKTELQVRESNVLLTFSVGIIQVARRAAAPCT